MNETHLKDFLTASIRMIEDVYSILEEAELLDNLATLDWLDKLNEISVRH